MPLLIISSKGHSVTNGCIWDWKAPCNIASLATDFVQAVKMPRSLCMC